MVPSVHVFISVLYVLRDITGVKCDEWLSDSERHLQLGRQLLAQGMYDDALSHYHAAIDADPYNYLTYYTRSTVYLAIGRVASALKDLSKVIELKPDFSAARIQRGNLYLKQGRLDEAHVDFEFVLRVDPANTEANHGYISIEPIKRDIEFAYSLFNDQNYGEAINLLAQLLQTLPADAKLREMRAQCYEKVGDIPSAISDLRSIKAQSDTHLRLSELYYRIGDTEEALNTIRECLRLDPDHKGCFTYYKYIKKVAAHLKAIQELINEGSYEECVVKAEKALLLEVNVPKVMFQFRARHCKCLNKAGQPIAAVKACRSALEIETEDTDLLCELAEAHLAMENYSEALSEFQKAANIDENSRRAHDGMKRAQKLEKQAKKRNYYAILGVPRTAKKKEILKAYRKMAMKWHPDQFQGDEKAHAEKKFIDIASAKEVLSDPEKRQKFDNGEDPLDPESQQGFNPFQQGFNPFDSGRGGGPFSFKFHFS